MRTIPNEHGHTVRQFDSVADFMDTPAYNAGSASWRWGTARNEATTRRMLAAGECTPESLAYAEESRARTLAAMPTTTATTKRRRRIFAESGDEWDTDRVLADHDRPAATTKIGKTASIVRLGVNIGIACVNNQKVFDMMIGTAAGAADALILAGYSVEILGICAATKNCREKVNVLNFPIKASDEPLDIQRVCSIGLPGLYRGWGIPRQDACPDTSCGGYMYHSDHYAQLAQVDALISAQFQGNIQHIIETLIGGKNEVFGECLA